jgi:hypothetical protein
VWSIESVHAEPRTHRVGIVALMPSADRPTTTPGPSSGSLGDVDALAARLRLFAEHDFPGYCPAYERIARGLAADPEALERLLGLVPVNRTPVLSLAATHYLVLGDPDGELAHIYGGAPGDPWPPFRALLMERTDEIRLLMATRSIQTNEVGRAAAIHAGLTAVAAAARAAGDTRPLALVEVGPSAGLNLLFDRFSIRYLDHAGTEVTRVGPSASPVQLTSTLRGPHAPALGDDLDLGHREGLDREPIDVRDDDACRWLAACLWPGVPDRPEQLAAALEVARREPPTLVAGDATVALSARLDALPPDQLPVVLATWALAYLDADGRAAVADAVDAHGRRADIALLTAEAPQVTPWIPTVAEHDRLEVTDGATGTVTVIGVRQWQAGTVRSEPLGFMHPHGRWLGWLGDDAR